MRYRTIIRDASVSLAAAFASVAGVGVLSATTADPVDGCGAPFAERVAACECRAQPPTTTVDRRASASRESCARDQPVIEQDLHSPSPVTSVQAVVPATGEHRALLLTMLFVAARIARRRLRLYRADGRAA